MKKRILKKGAAAAALFLLFAAAAQGSLTFKKSPLLILESKPGGTVRGAVEIYNADPVVPAAGRLYVDERKGRSCASWIEIKDGYFSVANKGTAKIRFTVRVPEEARGDYFAPLILAPTAAVAKKGSVRILTKYLGYIIVKTPGGEEALAFESTTYRAGELRAKVRNNGTTFHHSALSVFIDGKEFTGRRRLLLPGSGAEWAFDIRLPLGPHSAVLILDDGKGTAIGSRTAFRITEESTAPRDYTFFNQEIRLRFSGFLGERTQLQGSASTTVGPWSFRAQFAAADQRGRGGIGIGYGTRNFSIFANATIADRLRTSASASWRLGRFSIMASTINFFDTGHVRVAYDLKRGAYVGARAALTPAGLSATLEASVPLTISFRTRRRVRYPEPARPVTFEIRR